MSGIFKCSTAELAGWVFMRLPIFPHAESGSVGLEAMTAKEEANT